MVHSPRFSPHKLIFFFVTAAVAIVFFGALNNGLVNWDDEQALVRNAALRWDLQQFFFWPWRTRLLGQFQPLSWYALWAETERGSSSSAFWYHWTSVLLHSVIAGLIPLAAERTGSVLTGKKLNAEGWVIATAFALWFGLSPLRVEVVAWAACQSYLWGTLVAALSYLAFLRSLEGSTDAKKRFYRYSTVLFVIAVLFKVVVCILPLLFTFVRWVRAKEEKRATLSSWFSLAKMDWPLYLAALGSVGLALSSRDLVPTSPSTPHSVWETMSQPLVALGYAVGKLIFPYPVSPLYPMPTIAKALAIDAGILMGGIAAFFLGRRNRGIWVSCFVFAILFSPGVASVISERIAFSDRLSYFPAVGLAIVLSVVLGQRFSAMSAMPQKILAGLGFVGLILFGAQTPYDMSRWQESTKLWQHAVETTASESAIAHTNLGMAWFARGEVTQAQTELEKANTLPGASAENDNGLALCAIEQNRLPEAETHLREAIRKKPEYAEAYSNLGFVLSKKNQFALALSEIEHAIALEPGPVPFHESRARVLERLNRLPEAIEEWKYVVGSNPLDGEGYNLLGSAQTRAGDKTAAAESFQKAAALLPHSAYPNFNLAVILHELGHDTDARSALEAALASDPNFQPAKSALRDLAEQRQKR